MKKNLLAPLLTFFGVLITIVAPIIWNWYTSQSSLTLVKLSEVRLIEKKTSIDGLEILLNGKQINNLTKLSLKLKNTGEKPITEEEIIEPIEILFNDIRILDSSLDKTMPENITATITNEKNKISIIFKLLNPDDELYFSVLADTNKINFTTKARVKNVKQINIISIEDENLIKNNISWIVYVVGFFSILFFIIGIEAIFNEVPKGKHQTKILKSDSNPIKAGLNKDDYFHYIENDLRFLTEEKQDDLKNLLSNNSISPNDVEDVTNKIIEKIDAENSLGAMIFILLISGYGIWYTINNSINF